MQDDNLSKEVAISIIKSGFGTLPFVGTALNEIIFELRSRLKQQRLNNFVKEIQIRLSSIDEHMLSIDLLKSEEYSDLIEDVIRNTTIKKMHQNLSILAGITVECMQNQNLLVNPMLSFYIKTIAELTIIELTMLKKLSTLFRPSESNESFEIDYDNLSFWEVPSDIIFKISFDSLISKGLVIDDNSGWGDPPPRSRIQPTQLCIELFNIINIA